MTIHRRKLLTGALAMGMLPATFARSAEGLSSVYKLHEPQAGIDQMIAQSEFVDGNASTLGRFDATKDELLTAKAIVEGIPPNATPYQIALYFKDMTVAKKYTRQDPSKPLSQDNPKLAFNEEWGQRANPIIKEFFAATQTVPEGDCTAWCAAFVNWCALKSKIGKVLSGSAAAKSLIAWGDANGLKTETPQTGDICVVRFAGGGHHVTYVDGVTSATYALLGGNQGGAITDAGPTSCSSGQGAFGKVKVSSFKRSGAQYFFYTMAGFRS